MIFRVLLLIVLLISNFNIIFSQNLNVGIYADYYFVRYSNDFTKLPNINRPLNLLLHFDNNEIISPGIKVEYSFNNFFNLGLKSQYIEFTPQSTVIAKSTILKQGVPIEALIENKLNINNKLLCFQPFVSFNFWDILNFDLGLNLSYQFQSNYFQSQKLTSPSDVQFLFPISEKSGSIASKQSVIYGINTKISTYFTFPTDKSLKLEPSINFNYNINSFIKDVNLKNYYFGFGIAFTKEFKKNSIFIKTDTLFFRDTITIFTDFPKEVFLKKSNHEKINSQIVDNTQLITIKKYESYQKELQKMKSVLSGDLKTKFISQNEEENDKVKIIVKKTYTSLYEAKTINELEMILRNSNLIKFKLNDFAIEKAKVPKIKFYPTYYSEAGLKSWNINIKFEGKSIKDFKGNEDNLQALIWNIENELDIKKILNSQIEYSYVLNDIENQELQIANGIIKFAIDDSKETNMIENQKLVLLPIKLFKSIQEINNTSIIESLKNKELYSFTSTKLEDDKYSFKLVSEEILKNISNIKSDLQNYILIKF